MNPRNEHTIPSSDGGSSFLELLSAYKVDFLFYNPGSDFYPVLEQMSRFEIEGRKNPKPIMCLTEHLALSMSHGYSMTVGKAQTIMVHVGLGTMEIGGALHNIYRGREPVLIVAGRAPYTFEGELLGGRDRPYHWDQEIFDQLGVARQFSKWTYELKTNSNLPQVLGRALQVANSEPKGPAYLILPRELLAEKQTEVNIPRTDVYISPEPSQASEENLVRIASILEGADAPIILTEYSGAKSQGRSRACRTGGDSGRTRHRAPEKKNEFSFKQSSKPERLSKRMDRKCRCYPACGRRCAVGSSDSSN